ncbi:unnamed protein product [Penicillium olsonii]|nr:unnamed protein product [Penicillium olsonii]CAG7928996.1 unnamed protein product [Penicillium olsonii]
MVPGGVKRERSEETEDPHSSKRQRVSPPPNPNDPKWPRRCFAKTGSSGSSQSSTESIHGMSESDKVDVTKSAVIDKFRRDGEALVEWLDNPEAPGCPVQLSTLSFQDLIWAKLKKDRYQVVMRSWSQPPRGHMNDLSQLGLPVAAVYRSVWLRRHGLDGGGHRRFSEFSNMTVEGAIIGEAIFRYHGYNWSDIALAQYKMDFNIDTLKHIYFAGVVNVQTYPYVRDVIYNENDLPFKSTSIPCVWHYASRRYREIMGTRIGKSAACLVLGAWPRGTHRIERIQTWVSGGDALEIRFDIVDIVDQAASNLGNLALPSDLE